MSILSRLELDAKGKPAAKGVDVAASVLIERRGLAGRKVVTIYVVGVVFSKPEFKAVVRSIRNELAFWGIRW